MSNWFAPDKLVKVRKQQRCEACGHTIDPGETSLYQRGSFDREFFSRHLHPACAEIWFASLEDEYLGDFGECLYQWLEEHLGEAQARICLHAANDYSRSMRPPRQVFPPCEWCETTHGGCCCARMVANCAVCGDRCLPSKNPTDPDLCGVFCWADYQKGKRYAEPATV